MSALSRPPAAMYPEGIPNGRDGPGARAPMGRRSAASSLCRRRHGGDETIRHGAAAHRLVRAERLPAGCVVRQLVKDLNLGVAIHRAPDSQRAGRAGHEFAQRLSFHPTSAAGAVVLQALLAGQRASRDGVTIAEMRAGHDAADASSRAAGNPSRVPGRLRSGHSGAARPDRPARRYSRSDPHRIGPSHRQSAHKAKERRFLARTLSYRRCWGWCLG